MHSCSSVWLFMGRMRCHMESPTLLCLFPPPPRCTAKCMQQWGKYSETNNLVVKRRGEALAVLLFAHTGHLIRAAAQAPRLASYCCAQLQRCSARPLPCPSPAYNHAPPPFLLPCRSWHARLLLPKGVPGCQAGAPDCFGILLEFVHLPPCGPKTCQDSLSLLLVRAPHPRFGRFTLATSQSQFATSAPPRPPPSPPSRPFQRSSATLPAPTATAGEPGEISGLWQVMRHARCSIPLQITSSAAPLRGTGLCSSPSLRNVQDGSASAVLSAAQVCVAASRHLLSVCLPTLPAAGSPSACKISRLERSLHSETGAPHA